MLNESSIILLVVGITSGVSVLAMLNVLASIINHETKIVDYRNHIKDMQFQHALYMAHLENRIPEYKIKKPTSSTISTPDQASTETESQSDSILLPEQSESQAA